MFVFVNQSRRKLFLPFSVSFQPSSANSSQRNSFSNASGGQGKPLPSPSSNQPSIQQPNIIIFGHDVDSVDVATRVAMVRRLKSILSLF